VEKKNSVYEQAWKLMDIPHPPVKYSPAMNKAQNWKNYGTWQF
jgi:hypothetical protein